MAPTIISESFQTVKTFFQEIFIPRNFPWLRQFKRVLLLMQMVQKVS